MSVATQMWCEREKRNFTRLRDALELLRSLDQSCPGGDLNRCDKCDGCRVRVYLARLDGELVARLTSEAMEFASMNPAGGALCEAAIEFGSLACHTQSDCWCGGGCESD